MNVAPHDDLLESFEHLNRAQKRAFILRDQLKYLDVQHLDTFIEGISGPEPPNYKRTSTGVQPPLEEVRMKPSAARFDLSNIELADKSIRRVHLTCEEGSYEMQESEALPQDDDNLDSIPIKRQIAKNMIPLFKTKYEAIHERVQNINQTRKFMYEQALNRPPKPGFKDGKSLEKLLGTNEEAGASAEGEESRKRPGEPVTRHPLNKKKRIGLENVSNTIKTETVNRLPDQIKVELFNSFVRSAFPHFDSLMMACWNVISVYVSVGSDDLTLHSSIGDLHEVLMEFEKYYKPKKTSRADDHGSGDQRSGSVAAAAADRVFGTPHEGSNPSQNHARDRLVELLPERGSETGEPSSSKQSASRPRSSLPQSHADLFRSAKHSPRGSVDSSFVSGIDAGYEALQQQRSAANADRSSSRPEHTQRTADAAEHRSQQRSSKYGMFSGKSQHDSSDSLFVQDDESDEAIETPAMQEVLEHEQRQPMFNGQPVNLGRSQLGAPRPSNARGTAPVAPMAHNTPKKGERKD